MGTELYADDQLKKTDCALVKSHEEATIQMEPTRNDAWEPIYEQCIIRLIYVAADGSRVMATLLPASYCAL